jgi:glycosyltransferase involved in cell wall biosynthesis
VKKSILIFSVAKLDEMKQKGNITYIKHYEVFFDHVYMVYLTGRSDSFKDGNTHFISLGSKNTFKDLLLAPFRLYQFAKNKQISTFLTADLIFSWWNSLLIKYLLNAKIFLSPVAMPHEIYKSSKRTITGILPRFIEKIFINLSFLSAYKVVTGKNITQYVTWLSNNYWTKKKLLILEVLIDELPSYNFLKQINTLDSESNRKQNVLLYVGRLHKEKLVTDVIDAFNLLTKKLPELELWLIGDGEERTTLELQVAEYNLSNKIHFLGAKASIDLVSFYKTATLFISPLTGTSLREAALCGLPVVCYKMDWVEGTFEDKQEILFVTKNNIHEFAEKIAFILNDPNLYKTIQTNMSSYANKNWGTNSIARSLQKLNNQETTHV